MCGFLGVSEKKNFSEDKFISALDQLNHRGPDETKILSNQGVKLGFKRLKILDLTENGSQPMSSQDKLITIVFNGEIYNYKSIKKTLKNSGVHFKSNSDTEVLLNYYIYLNRDIDTLIENCNGMFSFAIVDYLKKKIYLVRDRLGVKPLYYYSNNDQIIFSSEIKSIKYLLNNKLNQSKEAIMSYLQLGFVPHWMSIYNEIKSIHPGSYGVWDFQKKLLKIKNFWSPKNIKIKRNYNIENWKDLIKKELLNATKIRLNSDVPIGLLLSGGIDSGLVAAAISKLGIKKINAHTIRFKNSSKDESKLAKKTANHLGLNLIIHDIDQITLNDVKKAVHHFDQPFADPSLIVTDFICKKINQNSTSVVLTGDGGDESFCGYREYLKLDKYLWINNLPEKILSKIGNFLSFIPNQKIKIISNRLKLKKLSRLMWTHVYPFDHNLNSLLNDEFKIKNKFNFNNIDKLIRYYGEYDELKIAQTADLLCYLPDNVLKKTDMMSMKNSIELRSPFLDYRLTEIGLSMPRKFKIFGNKTKYVLREIAKEWLPEEVTKSKKKGFGVPLNQLLLKNNNYSKELIDQILKLNEYQIFNEIKLKNYLKINNFSETNLKSIFKLFCLSIFLEKQ
ncbi:asparagine synthase (glutamine-hydrolyzing) [Candidatus Pelagibacter sp.]|nr:asparagine synthase (glutamine-hydrolyzing) [Candidatus Pelagibacter sp.]